MLDVAFALPLLLPAAIAQASFPGLNGRIAVTSESNYEIYTVNPDGTQTWRLTYDASGSTGCGQTGSDYGGQLKALFGLRLTDRYSGHGGIHPATTVDASFSFDFPCAPTPDTSIGSTCSAATSADAAMPGIAIEARRAIWQMAEIQVYDGGSDTDVDTPGDNTLFLTQGLFAP